VALSQLSRSPEEYRDSLAVLHEEAQRLARIVEDLFTLTRADAGEYRLAQSDFYLDELAADCVRATRALAQAKSIKLVAVTPEEMPLRADEDLLRRMIDDPASDDEFMFASDFYARKFGGQRTGICTALLRAGSTIKVDDAWRGNPEGGVAGVLRRQGHKVYHAENTLWHCLFGLLFWDELFETGQLHSGFDWMAQCLKNKTFMRTFGQHIEGKLAAVQSRTALPPILRSVAAHWAKPQRDIRLGSRGHGCAARAFTCMPVRRNRDATPHGRGLPGDARWFS